MMSFKSSIRLYLFFSKVALPWTYFRQLALSGSMLATVGNVAYPCFGRLVPDFLQSVQKRLWLPSSNVWVVKNALLLHVLKFISRECRHIHCQYKLMAISGQLHMCDVPGRMRNLHRPSTVCCPSPDLPGTGTIHNVVDIPTIWRPSRRLIYPLVYAIPLGRTSRAQTARLSARSRFDYV